MSFLLEELQPKVVDNRKEPAGRDLGGLLARTGSSEKVFPLREVKVRAFVAGDRCRTVVEQQFDNPYDVALEAVHIFPLPPDGAVTEMEMRAGDVVVRAECRERAEAEKIFEKARKAGRRAALLTEERPDVHTLRITNVPPKTAVSVRMVVIEQLQESDGRLCLRFPTVIAPRYMPGEPIGHEGDGATPDTTSVPDASRLQPPLRLSGGTRLDIEVAIEGRVRTIESSLHAVRAEMGDSTRVAPSTRATLDRDFVLWFAYDAGDEISARAVTDGKFTLVVVNPPKSVAKQAIPRDAVFVVDISGSMGGEKMEAAKRALSLTLRGLDAGDRFRLIAFDTALEEFSDKFEEYTKETVSRADRWIRSLEARGGTEMLPALHTAFHGKTPAGRLRTVLFVTDGQAGNDAELIAAVSKERAGATLFTVGIDTAVNDSLLKRLARAGGGTCELLTPGDNIEEAIVRIESRLGAPLLNDLQVDNKLKAARPQPGVLYTGRPATLLLEGTAKKIRLHGTTPEGKATFAATPVHTDFPLGALWARERIAWFEEQLTLKGEGSKSLRKEILSVALEHGIASRFTAFVAVEEKRSNDGERVTVVQPAELPYGWSESFQMMSAIAPGPATLGICCSLALPHPRVLRSYSSLCDADAGVPAGMMDSLCCDEADLQDDVPRRPSAGRPDDLARDLVLSQEIDGSFGGDVGRTAAAVVTLLLLGSTRTSGLYQRFLAKAARWLESRKDDAVASLALALVERAENGSPLPQAAEVAELMTYEPEGDVLRIALNQP